jgi:putative ABC transport system ATP-binding protein
MTSALEPPVLQLRGVTKLYGHGPSTVRALDGVDMDVARGEFVAITGPSGSGKSTVMSILGCLELPTSGEYSIEGVPVQGLSNDVLSALRNRRFGFVFQSFNLLSRTSAVENVGLPLVYAGTSRPERIGLADRCEARPNELSGGQQQRVAIARALVNDPEILLADEPTGNLDSKRGQEIMELLTRLNTESGITVLIVTHDPRCAAYAAREVQFLDGHIAHDARITRP